MIIDKSFSLVSKSGPPHVPNLRLVSTAKRIETPIVKRRLDLHGSSKSLFLLQAGLKGSLRRMV